MVIDTIKTLAKDIKDGTSYSVSFIAEKDIEKSLSEKGIKVRKLLAPLLRKVYLTQTPYKLIKEKQPELKEPKSGKIYIINHRQGDDIVLGANAVGESAYIVFGNKYLALDTLNGLGLWGYGVILLDRDDKESRKITYDKMKYVLNHGGNIIIYPEGYWNLDDNGLSDERHKADDHNSENWIMQDINVGVVRLAQETGCPIIPTVLHYDEVGEKKCYSKKGNPIYVSSEDDVFAKKDEIVEKMWEIYIFDLMQKYSTYNREELEKNIGPLKENWEKLKRELVASCDIPRTGYHLDLQDEKRIGKAKVVKEITTNDDAFAHLEQIEINQNNAFLLSKRLTGKRQ